MFEFNANVFETNILNLRIVVGIVAVMLVDVLRNKVNQRRLLIRNTKLEILKKKHELQRELESFWVFERYIVEKCNFISESEKRSIEIELYKQIRNEKVQKKLYQEKYNKALLAKTEQMKRLLVRNTFASAIRRAKILLKEEFYINRKTYVLAIRRAKILLKEESYSNVDFETFFYFILSPFEVQVLHLRFQPEDVLQTIRTLSQHKKLNKMLASQAYALRVKINRFWQ